VSDLMHTGSAPHHTQVNAGTGFASDLVFVCRDEEVVSSGVLLLVSFLS